MSENRIQITWYELRVTMALMAVVTACYASAIGAIEYGYWPGAAGAFGALLASMYLLSTVFKQSGRARNGSGA